MRVLLPEPGRASGSRSYPTLFLLHGLSDDESAWTRYSGLERYVNELNLAVIMPNVHRSSRRAEITTSSPACRWEVTARSSSG